jgi:hypothetical protein
MRFPFKRPDPNDKVAWLSRVARGAGRVELVAAAPPDAAVPEVWRTILRGARAERVAAAVAAWRGLAASGLPQTIDRLAGRLEDVELMRVGSSWHLLYSMGGGRPVYWAGSTPAQARPGAALGASWDSFPASLRQFYQFQDGFYSFTDGAGLAPLARVLRLGDLEWGVIEDLSLAVQVDLNTTFAFCANGAGGYAAIDAGDCDRDKAVLWWATEAPVYDLNFWEIVDAWLAADLG